MCKSLIRRITPMEFRRYVRTHNGIRNFTLCTSTSIQSLRVIRRTKVNRKTCRTRLFLQEACFSAAKTRLQEKIAFLRLRLTGSLPRYSEIVIFPLSMPLKDFVQLAKCTIGVVDNTKRLKLRNACRKSNPKNQHRSVLKILSVIKFIQSLAKYINIEE